MPVAQLTAKADTVMFCLSKGLGAPVGSLLVGSAELMDRARIYRKALGGGMRQAGILAAAGLIALEQGPQKLAQDHANAKFLAEGLAQIPGIKIDPAKVQTNILICDTSGSGITGADLSRKLAERNVLASAYGPYIIRFVTHLDVNREQCAQALEIVAAVCGRNVNSLTMLPRRLVKPGQNAKGARQERPVFRKFTPRDAYGVISNTTPSPCVPPLDAVPYRLPLGSRTRVL